jgi:tetratricopeptide (TPR) repeat protein
MTTLDLSDNRDPEFQLACSFYSGDYWTAALQARTLQSPARLYWEIRAYQQLAIAALNQAAIYAADSPEIHVLIGDIYRQRQHIEEAQSEYNRALALNPQDRGALLGLALVWYMTRHYNEALSAGQKLLEVSPQDPRLNLLVGETLVGLYRYKDAIDYLERSRSANREFLPRVHALLGRCYAAEENETQAIREFTLALAEDEDGSIHYQLARLYRKHGDLERSTALFAESKRLQQLRLQRASLAFKETEQSPPMEER